MPTPARLYTYRRILLLGCAGPSPKLHTFLPQLASARRRLEVISFARTPSELVDRVQAIGMDLESWSLEYEMPFPARNTDTLPFLDVSGVPALSIQLSRAIRGTVLSEPRQAKTRLVLVQLAEEGFVLGRAMGGDLEDELVDMVKLWSARPFTFSASLDPYIAVAAVNITLWYVFSDQSMKSPK